MPLAIGLTTEPDFDSFLPGANRALLESLRELQPGSPPVYVYGPSGSGKTHLLTALAHAWQQRGLRCGFFKADLPLPWRFDEAWDLVVIDDAERLDALRQHAAFTLFVEAASSGALVASAGRLPPVDLPLREDLRTRFGWGLVFALAPLSEGDTRLALSQEAGRRGLHLSDEVLDYLLSRLARDLGSLMGLLRRLDHFALAEGRGLTLPLLKKMWAEEGLAP